MCLCSLCETPGGSGYCAPPRAVPKPCCCLPQGLCRPTEPSNEQVRQLVLRDVNTLGECSEWESGDIILIGMGSYHALELIAKSLLVHGEMVIKDPSPETLQAYKQPTDSGNRLWLYSAYMQGEYNKRDGGGTTLRPLVEGLMYELTKYPGSRIVRRRLDWSAATLDKAETHRKLDDFARSMAGVKYETDMFQMPPLLQLTCTTSEKVGEVSCMEAVAAAYEKAGIVDPNARVAASYLAKEFTQWGGSGTAALQGGLKCFPEELLSPNADLPEPFAPKSAKVTAGAPESVHMVR